VVLEHQHASAGPGRLDKAMGRAQSRDTPTNNYDIKITGGLCTRQCCRVVSPVAQAVRRLYDRPGVAVGSRVITHSAVTREGVCAWARGRGRRLARGRTRRASRSRCNIAPRGAQHGGPRADQRTIDEIAAADAGIESQSSTLRPARKMTHVSTPGVHRQELCRRSATSARRPRLPRDAGVAGRRHSQRFEHIADSLLWRCFDISAIVITSAAT